LDTSRTRFGAWLGGGIHAGADGKFDRYDYDARSHQLVVRMPTGIHEIFIARVEDAIHSQLKVIQIGSDKAAIFAQKVFPARSTEIHFLVDDGLSDIKSKNEPDASF
jgi:hypothetical protein